MNKTTAFLKIFITAGFLSILLFNVGSVQGAAPPGDPDNLSPQAKGDSPSQGKTREQNWLADQEDKHERFNQLEWLIKQCLLKRYEKMEMVEDSEELRD